MRLVVCGLSALLLSGCSWLGGQGGSFGSQNSANLSSQFRTTQNFRYDPCVVISPRAPIPRGCDPSQVTIGTASGGFPQQPNFGGNFASGGFGSHAGVAGQQAANYQPKKRLRKPRWRGSLSLGFEKSFSGDLLDYDSVPNFDPGLNYNPADYDEGLFREGSRPDGEIVDTLYTAVIEDVSRPNITFDDAHSTPLNIKGGVEYIVSPRTSVFANLGYAYSEGESDSAISITGELQRHTRTRTFQTLEGLPAIPAMDAVPATDTSPAIPARPAVAATPDTFQLISDTPGLTVIPNVDIANYVYEFSDLNRIDLEIGGRHYFNPLVKDQGFKTLTPFVGGSIGAARLNGLSVDITQNQLFYQRAFEDENNEFFGVVPPNVNGPTRVQLYDSQWVPTGQLNAGVEWQVTPKTALAFESGLRFEGAREYSNGENGDTNIAVPFTVRGSYNF